MSELRPALTAGVDEAGRGPLAGPVVIAAVILDPTRRIRGLADSKVLTAARREILDTRIRERAIAFSVIAVDVSEIDRHNIFQATMLTATHWSRPSAPHRSWPRSRAIASCASWMRTSRVTASPGTRAMGRLYIWLHCNSLAPAPSTAVVLHRCGNRP